ncbi:MULTISPECIES: hypothetical protein [unclassified Blastococcus]|nr:MULTISPECIES: hypothetical protein [unclassified Blastococcus]
MGDKSPGRNTKKAGRSIKEKRAEKRARTEGSTPAGQLTSRRKS